jgi:hypothetical protein
MEYKLKCDYCESEKIVKNVQECYVEYDYDYKTGEYSQEPTTINEPFDNKHLCQKCYNKWSIGDLF